MHLLLGVFVAVVSSAVQSMGLTLQRKAHVGAEQTGPQPASNDDAGLTLWRWGVLLFVAANVLGSTVQIVSLPLLVLCPLQAVGLVFNSVWASAILSEPFTRRSAEGTALVALGAALVAGLGAQDEPERSLPQLEALFCRPVFIFWMLVTLSCVALLVYVALDTQQHRGILLGASSGVLSAHSLLMAKLAVGLALQAVTGHWTLLLRWQVWAIVLSFLVFAVSQLYFVNRGLQYLSTSVLYPLVFCVYNLTSMLNGLVFYGLSELFNARQMGWVIFGTLFLLAGVLLLSSRLDTRPEGDVESTEVDTLPLLRSRYTSLDSINPNISNPERPFRPRRVLSKEQTEILNELSLQ